MSTNLSSPSLYHLQSQCLSIYREIDPDVHHLILTFAVSSSINNVMLTETVMAVSIIFMYFIVPIFGGINTVNIS
jgi:hypothetical protein